MKRWFKYAFTLLFFAVTSAAVSMESPTILLSGNMPEAKEREVSVGQIEALGVGETYQVFGSSPDRVGRLT
ncbi:MAG: hypothetical protein JMN25_18690 [gamma proteobacterium endosymbiont of Lamellibrachia anaximandri]|nr:hypothetical protein [gamma proteobacterium endosymbiont of Lamellibrachia anaximandri]